MQNFKQALLQTPPGKIHVVTGVNGVGKTTLMMKLREELQYSGHKVSVCTQKPLVTLSHWRTVDLVSYLEGSWDTTLELKLMEEWNFKEAMGLTKNALTPVMKLSGGENQILKLYLCLAMKADFYFLDEPSTYLDRSKREYLINLLLHLKGLGKTFFIIEHDSELIKVLSDYTWELKERGVMEGVTYA